MTAERSDDLERLRPAMFCRECGYLGLAVAGHGCPGDESPQDVTYQEAILDGADPMDGFYGD